MPRDDGPTLVLIVDDEQNVADTLSTILNRSGYDARAVYSGETALVLARSLRPDVIISDVIMGSGMNGIELAIQVKREIPECRTILHSAHSVTWRILEIAEAEGHHFEVSLRPIHPQAFLNRLADLRQRGEGGRETPKPLSNAY